MSAVSRRQALKTLALGAGTFALARVARAQARPADPDGLRLAFIGVGGQGAGAVKSLTDQHYVAFCDVDEAHAAGSFAAFPEVPRFRDFRRMFDRHHHEIDGVIISTPDHAHHPMAMAAMQLGLHVYVEKPLATSIWECRQLAAAAAHHRVRTQLGIQGHSAGALRLLREWIHAGVAGPIHTVHLWTDRMQPRRYHWATAPAPGEPVPSTLDWDLWLAARPHRDFSREYVPNRWRNWWDFGTGPIGDIGVHMFDVLEFVLELGVPTAVSAVTPDRSPQTAPPWTEARWEFPGRGARPAVTVHWCNGTRDGIFVRPAEVPHVPAEVIAATDNAIVFVGREATVFVPDMRSESAPQIFPVARERDFLAARPAPTLPRPRGGHFRDWFGAIREGREAGAAFSYGGPLTETALLGVLAQRTGRTIRWDAAGLRTLDAPEADALIRPAIRPGWEYQDA